MVSRLRDQVVGGKTETGVLPEVLVWRGGKSRIERAVYDERRVQDAVLALMHLTAHPGQFGGWRAWKSFPWEATDGLYERGLIGDPKSKARSVVLTDEGVRLAEQLFVEMFGTEDADAHDS